MKYYLFVRWHNIETLLIMTASHGGLYPNLVILVDRVRVLLSVFRSDGVGFLYYSGLCICRGSEDIRRVVTLLICGFAIVASVLVLLYAAERAAPDYYVWSLRFDHVGDGMLIRLPTFLVDVPGHFLFHKISEKMHRDPYLLLWRFTV